SSGRRTTDAMSATRGNGKNRVGPGAGPALGGDTPGIRRSVLIGLGSRSGAPSTGGRMPTVTITTAPLTLDELLEIARGARVELGPDARTLIGASRAVVDAALASGRPVYGLNTGIGHLKDVRLPDEEVRRLQQ